MESLQIDRRARMPGASAGADLSKTTRIVREGVLLQPCLGTVGAIEYLKAHDVSSAVIARVLSRERMRQEDQAMLAQQERSEAACL
jgi:hypothetical protein